MRKRKGNEIMSFTMKCLKCKKNNSIKVSLSVGKDNFIIQCGNCGNSIRQCLSFTTNNGMLEIYKETRK